MSVTPPTSICPYGDSSDDQNVLLRTQIESIPSTRQCSRLQTAAYLLGARQELPDLVHNSETNRIRAVQSWYSSESSDGQPIEPHPTCYQGPEQPEHLEKGISDSCLNFVTISYSHHTASRISNSIEHCR